MDLMRLAAEFHFEDFDPKPAIVGSGILIGERRRVPHFLTFQQHDSTLAVHDELPVSGYGEIGESWRFEVTIVPVNEETAAVTVKTVIKQPEEVCNVYPMLSALLKALDGLTRAID